MDKEYYKILGVSENATQADIKKAYRKLARKWHPDINPGDTAAEQKFKEISRANDCLGNKKRRKLYDEFGEESLKAGFDAEKAREYKQWGSFQQGAGMGGNRQGFGRYQSYEDVFGDFFSAGAGQGGFGKPMSARGRDMEHEMTIDLLSALRGFDTELSMEKIRECSLCHGSGMDPGSTMTTCATCGGSGRMNVAEGPMQFTRPCPQCKGHGTTGTTCSTCGGNGRVSGMETIKVTIPRGVREGSKVRVAGKGEPGMHGGTSGDLYLIIHIKDHPFLTRDGDNLLMDVPVTVYEAMAGGMITIPTPEGEVKVKVPAKSQNGQRLKLKGKGAVDPRTKKKGDLFIKLSVKVPRTDDKDILEAVEKLDGLYEEDLRQGIRF